MTPATRRALHASHAWAGAVLGLAIFVVCLTGVWAVADGHLRHWEAGAMRAAPPRVADVDRLLAAAREQGMDTRNASIRLPTALHRTATVSQGRRGPGAGEGRGARGSPRRLSLDVDSARPATDAVQDATMAPVVTTLHKSLYAGFWGRIAVSLVGVALTVLLLGGIALHTRRWRDWTALRLAQGRRQAVLDLHKLVGLWLLPALLLVSVTGIFSGLGALGTLTLSRFAYAGGMAQALGDLTPGAAAGARPAGVAATMRPVQALLDAHRERDPSFEVETLTLSNWGDANATLAVAGTRAGLLSTAVFERALYRARDGELLRDDSARGKAFWVRAFVAVQPLHYAQYGGGWGLALHLLAGVGAMALAATGTLLWLARRTPRGARPPWAACGVTGIGGGLLVACAALLLTTACGAPASWQSAVFLGGWAVAAALLLWACRVGRLASLLPCVAGGLLLAAAGVDLPRSLAQPLAVSAPALSVDVFLFSVGAGLLALGWRLRSRPAIR